MTSKRIRVYELYMTLNGFTERSVAYQGFITAVSARSLKQALFFAHNGMWVKSTRCPLGIIWEYQKGRAGGDHLTPSGKWSYLQPTPRSGSGVTDIRLFLKACWPAEPAASYEQMPAGMEAG
jgi:hypothetical protein